jgi:Tol biopolymer transport system component
MLKKFLTRLRDDDRVRPVILLVLILSLVSGCSSSEAEPAAPSSAQNGLIAFTRQHESKIDQLFALRSDGSGERALTPDGVTALDGVWSPNGRLIAFVGATAGGGRGLYVMNADGSGKRLLVQEKAPVGSSGRPSWSPDGKRLVFVGSQISSYALYVVRSDGSGLRRLAGEIGSDPAWSPDGKRIALASDVGQLILIDLQGRVVDALTSEGVCVEWPAWSPDGTRLAYVASGSDCFGDSSIIRVVDADGGNDETLTHPPDGVYDEAPAWSPDGQQIAFQRGDLALGDIYILDVESGDTTGLTSTELHQDFDPSWQPLPAP